MALFVGQTLKFKVEAMALQAVRVAVLVNPANATAAEATLRGVQEAARAIGLQIQVFNASRRVQIATLAARDRIPAAYPDRTFAAAGGLMSYGTSLADTFRQVGIYTGSILKGTRPADLPVVQSTRFEFVINLGTAKLLGLEVPETLLATADEVIQ